MDSSYNESEVLIMLQDPETIKQGFELLVRHYSSRLYWQIRRLVLSHDDANDILQDTFIKAWTNIDNFRGDSKISTWFYRIALNECLTFLNNKKAEAKVSLEDADALALQSLEGDSFFSGDRAELMLQKALRTLPEKQRMVFNLRYYDEMQYSQMSEILGTTVGALKADYHHAVKKIQKFLEDND